MNNFRKNVNCPASQELLALHGRETSMDESLLLSRHLSSCEFCAAEAEFYARFPQAAEDCPETEIPQALYDLAEALLNQHKNFSLLNKLLEAESIKI